jgi:hypothetical protein
MPKSGHLNPLLLRSVFEYEWIANIFASSLEKVFTYSQNFNPEYKKLGARSLSVGDIIVEDANDIHHFVAGTGFVEIPSTVTHYINLGRLEAQAFNV